MTVSLLTVFGTVFLPSPASAAACTTPTTDYGTATSSVTIPADATYRIWSNVNVPDATNNTYLLEVDGKDCFNVGGAGLTAQTWQWIAHRDANTSLKSDLALTKGSHTLKLIGNKPGVKVARVVFAADLNCTPVGDGTNCSTPTDTAAPTVQLTAPAADSSVGSTVNITANASDNTGVTKVEFSVNGSVITTDTSAPYSATWNTSEYPNGLYALKAVAYDAAGNTGQSSYRVTVENGDKIAPSVPSGVTAVANAYNKVTVSWTASTDNVGVKGYTVIRDGLPVGTVSTGVTYVDMTNVAADTTYMYRVQAFDAAGNKSASSSEVTVRTPSVPDTQAPTTPGNLRVKAVSSNQLNLTWTESTDNTGVVAYDIYRGVGSAGNEKIASVQTTSYADAGLTPDTAYDYYVKARDAAGNQSTASSEVAARTPKSNRKGSIKGTITNNRTGRPVAHSFVAIKDGKRQKVYTANRKGVYQIPELLPAKYKVTYHAWGYRSTSVTLTVTDQPIIKNVRLIKY